jgi:adenine-specific DNA-methyltransferase
MATLNWIGKEKVINHHLEVPFKTLKHVYTYKNGQKLTDGTRSENKIIHGDNLLALKSLLPEYEGKIKCIYIDPPYNTGNEGWVYNDNVNHPKIKKWLGEVVGKEGEDLSRHDKWLCMMYPRIKLLHRLLKDDGIIFISIDDNEIANLIKLTEEVFGSSTNHHLATFVWKSSGNFDNQAKIKINHEYILAYSKNASLIKSPPVVDPNISNESKLFKSEIRNTLVKNGLKNPPSEITLPQGFPASFKEGIINIRQDKWPHFLDNAIIKDFRLQNSVRVYSGWSSKNILEEFINSNFQPVVDTKGQESVFEITQTGAIEVVKKRSSSQSYVVSVLENMGNTQSTSNSLKNYEIDFAYPKPTALIEYLVKMSTANEDIVLDSFAGTGTTAHAVINLNKEKYSKRKFILIELEDYAEKFTAKRVSKCLDDVSKNNSDTFEFLELGGSLFNEEGNINETLPINDIRLYVYYSETRTSTGYSANPKNKYYLGKRSHSAYYFYYEKDKVTTLDLNFVANIEIKSDLIVIYADKCALSERYLNEHNITFKKIPRDITRI